MKNNDDNDMRKIIGALVFLLCVSFVCVICANCMSPNSASIIGGVLSVLATTFLGVIAFWQNKRYKDLSDEMNDRMLMPDFFKAELTGEKLSEVSHSVYNGLSYSVHTDEPTKTIDCSSFMIINAPILNLRAKTIQHDDKVFYFKDKQRSIYNKDSGFSLKLVVPNSFIEHGGQFQVSFEYENMYGTSYSKEDSFTLSENADYATKWNLSRARRL